MKLLDTIYNHLKRTTSSTAFIPQIDGLRFVAIFMVLFYHLNTFVITKASGKFAHSPLDFWWLYQAGLTDRKGVLLFFMISGFILALPFAKWFWQNGKPVSLRAYFLRRLTRLEPPYIIVMLLSFAALMLYAGHDFAASFTQSGISLWRNFAASIIYSHNIIYPKLFSVNPVAWSLEIEVQFYILVPLLVWVLKAKAFVRRLLLCALILFFIYIHSIYPPTMQTLYAYLQYFLLGFLLVDVYLSGYKLNLHWLVSLVCGAACLTVLFYLDIYRQNYFEYIFAAVIFFLGFLALTDQVWKSVFALRPLTVVGGMCYSIYLLHTSIISLAGNRSVHLFFSSNYPVYVLVQTLILLPVILLVCGGFYVLIERPCMDREWPKKLWALFKSFTNKRILNSQPAQSQ